MTFLNFLKFSPRNNLRKFVLIRGYKDSPRNMYRNQYKIRNLFSKKQKRKEKMTRRKHFYYCFELSKSLCVLL